MRNLLALTSLRSMRKECGAVDGKPAEAAPVLKKEGAVGATPAAKDGEAELKKKLARLERANGDLQAAAGSRLERRREGRIGAPEETFLLIRDIAELKGEVARLEKANIGLQVAAQMQARNGHVPTREQKQRWCREKDLQIAELQGQLLVLEKEKEKGSQSGKKKKKK